MAAMPCCFEIMLCDAERIERSVTLRPNSVLDAPSAREEHVCVHHGAPLLGHLLVYRNNKRLGGWVRQKTLPPPQHGIRRVLKAVWCLFVCLPGRP